MTDVFKFFSWSVLHVLTIFIVLWSPLTYCFSANSPRSPTKVVVTGAGSSVGYLCFKKLLARKKTFSPVGLVRDKRGYDQLLKLGATPEQIRMGDITNKESLRGVFDGAEKVVLCTSARPRKKFLFQFKDVFRKLFRRERPAKATELYYPKHQTPWDVDFIGQKNTIDACLNAKVEHIVMLGNMGGYRGSKLNDIGKKTDKNDPRAGNLLKWKRAAERYLMKRCFFTIVHAGALTDDRGGHREIVWDVDDSLLRTNFRKIPREDVAEVLVQALIWKEAIGRSIDIASRPEGQGAGPTKDWLRFWCLPGNCAYPADYDEPYDQ